VLHRFVPPAAERFRQRKAFVEERCYSAVAPLELFPTRSVSASHSLVKLPPWSEISVPHMMAN
jgi:hypothetical protein